MSVDPGFILKQRLVSQKRVSYIKRLIEVKEDKNNLMTSKFKAMEYFDLIDEDTLTEMIVYHPGTLEKMCMLISLDLQFYKENN